MGCGCRLLIRARGCRGFLHDTGSVQNTSLALSLAQSMAKSLAKSLAKFWVKSLPCRMLYGSLFGLGVDGLVVMQIMPGVSFELVLWLLCCDPSTGRI